MSANSLLHPAHIRCSLLARCGRTSASESDSEFRSARDSGPPAPGSEFRVAESAPVSDRLLALPDNACLSPGMRGSGGCWLGSDPFSPLLFRLPLRISVTGLPIVTIITEEVACHPRLLPRVNLLRVNLLNKTLFQSSQTWIFLSAIMSRKEDHFILNF